MANQYKPKNINYPGSFVTSSYLIPSMVPGDFPEFYVPTIVAGKVFRITGTLQGALAVGNTVITFQINGVNITNGVLTFVQAGSAAGDSFSIDPTGLNSVIVGSELKGTLTGTNNSPVVCALTVTFSY